MSCMNGGCEPERERVYMSTHSTKHTNKRLKLIDDGYVYRFRFFSRFPLLFRRRIFSSQHFHRCGCSAIPLSPGCCCCRHRLCCCISFSPLDCLKPYFSRRHKRHTLWFISNGFGVFFLILVVEYNCKQTEQIIYKAFDCLLASMISLRVCTHTHTLTFGEVVWLESVEIDNEWYQSAFRLQTK